MTITQQIAAVATADFGCLRLRTVEYSNDDPRRCLDTMERVGAGWRDAFVFFKHEEASTRRASAFQDLILHTSNWPHCPPFVRVQGRTGDGSRNFGRE